MVFVEAIAEAARRRGLSLNRDSCRACCVLWWGTQSVGRCEVKKAKSLLSHTLTLLIVPVARLREAWRSKAPMIQLERLPLAYIDCPDPCRLQG